MPLVSIETFADFEAALSSLDAFFVFKHSTRCPVSARAEERVDAFVATHPDIPVHRVLVVEQRPVSLSIAERLEVAHASPQIILIRDGRAVWDTSHLAVTVEAMLEAWEG